MLGLKPTPEWFDFAPCKGRTDIFFTGWMGSGPRGREAKDICASCSYKEPCLEYGKDEVFGIWGGLSPKERGIRKTDQNKISMWDWRKCDYCGSNFMDNRTAVRFCSDKCRNANTAMKKGEKVYRDKEKEIEKRKQTLAGGTSGITYRSEETRKRHQAHLAEYRRFTLRS